MFQGTYIVFLIITILYNKMVSCFGSFYGVRTNENPKISCRIIANIETDVRCLGTCGITMKTIDMISHDLSTKTCMCCSDLTGSDITGPNLKSYVPRTCKYLIYLIKVLISKIENEIRQRLTSQLSLYYEKRRRI